MTVRPVETADVDVSLDLETIRTVLEEHPVRLAIRFGSHTTGTDHTASDIDLAVEFDAEQPSGSGYTETFFGLSADLSEALETDDVDLVNINTVSPALAASIFDHGLLLVGELEHAIERRQAIVGDETETQSPREQLDASLAGTDAHLDGGEAEVPVSGRSEDDG